MATLTEVARHAGVSIATASMVLNPGKQQPRVSAEVAERVRAAARTLNYVPNYHAQSMKLGRADNIAVSLDIGGVGAAVQHADLSGSYFGTIIGAVELVARNRGFQTTIVGPHAQSRAPDRGILGIRQRRFDGLVVPGLSVRQDLTDFFQQTPDVPAVVVEYPGQTAWPVVDWDEAAGVRLAVDHLAELGHRRLLWLGPWEDAATESPSPRERLAATYAAERGLELKPLRFDPHYPPEPVEPWPAAPVADAAHAALRAHLVSTTPAFTAILCWNDNAGIGACGALLEAGYQIPRDVSVIGFDNIEAKMCIPRLTSVSHRLHDMGARAAEMLLEMVNDAAAITRYRGVRESLQPILLKRQSAGPAPQR